MAQQSRTNYLKVENLAPELLDGRKLCSMFEAVGEVIDLTSVDASTVVVTYRRRTGPENAVFALDSLTNPDGSKISLSLFHPGNTDVTKLKDLGLNIGNDSFVYDPTTFNKPNVQASAASNGLGLAVPMPIGVAYFNPYSSSTKSSGARSKRHVNLPNYGHFPLGSTQSQPPDPKVSRPNSAGPSTSNGDLSGGKIDVIKTFSKPWSSNGASGSAEQCSICICDFDDQEDSESEEVVTLADCPHSFHYDCLSNMMKASLHTHLQCPVCKKIYGVKTGNMPTTGTISHRLCANSLAGYEGVGSIEINFNFRSGTQGPEHPHPGVHYQATGFPRLAYLPDNEEGTRLLHGLYLAWQQRLLFTVGKSITTGRAQGIVCPRGLSSVSRQTSITAIKKDKSACRQDNCITWNDIHMKTECYAGGLHGYPDPGHLKNLAEELEIAGITLDRILSHMKEHADLKTRGRL